MAESHFDNGGRTKTLTERGQNMFEELFDKHTQRVRKAWEEVECCFVDINSSDDLTSLEDLNRRIGDCIQTHNVLIQDLIDYCLRTNTEQSIKCAEEHIDLKNSREMLSFTAKEDLVKKMKDIMKETSSVLSGRSRRSVGSKFSDSSSMYQRKKAKAEAAKIRLAYAEVEAELKKKQVLMEEQKGLEDARVQRQKADIEIELELLSQRRETAAVEAEADALEVSEHISGLCSVDENLPKAKPNDNLYRVHEFVEQSNRQDQDISELRSNLNPNADPFLSHQSFPSARDKVEYQQPQVKDLSMQNTVSDITHFLLKKDLLLSRLTGFNDKPESYRVWKQSFKTIMEELRVTPLEELDLLQKWCGPESQRHVISVKATNVSNPALALRRIWDRLDERFGCPEFIEASIKKRISNFPKLTAKDNRKLYDLSDLVSEIEFIRDDQELKSQFSYFDCSTGVTPIVNKLPYGMQEKWTNTAAKYMKHYGVVYPPFSVFSEFLREQSRIRNNPSFAYEVTQTKKEQQSQRNSNSVSVKKTETKELKDSSKITSSEIVEKCPLHQTDHSLNVCRTFKGKPLQERFKFLRERKLCFGCCKSTSHVKKDCPERVKCDHCKSVDHPTALHVNSKDLDQKSASPAKAYGGEMNLPQSSNISKDVSSACTQICGKTFPGKSCSKIVLGDIYFRDKTDKRIRLYIMIDDQSNRSLGTSELFDALGIHGNETSYILTSCSGKVQASGRRATGLVVESLDQQVQIDLPTVTECSSIPDNRDEIPTQNIAMCYPHLQDISHTIPPIDEDARIMLLLGRDVIKAHHVIDQRIGPGNKPYAQRLPLGWTIIGESCLGNTHIPEQFNVNKINILENGRTTHFDPCKSTLMLSEIDCKSELKECDTLGQNVFIKSEDDDRIGLSVDDRTFLEFMAKNFRKDDSGYWTCPLPFRSPRQRLKNNAVEIFKRAKTLDKVLSKDPVKKEQFMDFMNRLIERGHAEEALALDPEEECWYIPIFGVYHPRKKDEVRVVFDSAAKYGGISLNDVLLSGPDLTNSLLGVLMRFRREPVAVVGDIQQMFYCFKVNEEHRNYLRFFWHADNDFDKPLVEFRMCVHVFGNTASPAVASYGLRKSACKSTSGSDVTEFVFNDFYVDDGLTSQRTVEEAVSLIRRTQKVLSEEGRLRLHKIASNCEEVMLAFPPEDLAKNVKDLDFGLEVLPTQRTLGVAWNLESDSFIFHIAADPQPYTRRGLLSTINSIFDPLGFLAPVVIEGKLLLRNLVHGTIDWDMPLPEEYHGLWDIWRDSLSELHKLKIPRVYIGSSFSDCQQKSVHIFSDASEKAIAAVGYLKSSDEFQTKIGFILGKAKVAPVKGHTIPRLELCAAVLAVELAESISLHLNLPVADFKFYTDSKVILGYIHNESRRFYTYVANRVHRIRKSTNPDQWSYIPTDKNPADQGTRSIPASEMYDSVWIKGPAFLHKVKPQNAETYQVQDPENDKEIRPEVRNLKTEIQEPHLKSLGSHRFDRFSCWNRLVQAIARLTHVAQSYSKESLNKQNAYQRTVESFNRAENYIIREVQKEVFSEEYQSLKVGHLIPRGSPISSLNPYLDDSSILRIGGRLKNGDITFQEKSPIIIPGKHHIAALLVRYYHEKVEHQGRHFTAGAVRSAGFWVTGGKRLISSMINRCVKCRKLRGTLSFQKMADLPMERLEICPPFTNVGVDCFGPWNIVTRRTRGGQSNSKRWAALFTCLSTRAIHIEVLEEMSASSFINALKRFVAIRGPVKQFRSDQGTNFVGATTELGLDTVNVEDGKVRDFLYDAKSTWVFNPPYSSHMGGIWERMIGVTRRILDSLLQNVPGNCLTHETLTTFLAEATAIVNSRPLVAVSCDPEDPFPLSPSMLLTQKPQVITTSTDFDTKDMYVKQWKAVQVLAERFWQRWRSQYLQTLQSRRKWQSEVKSFQCGDVVLIRNKQEHRNSWPIGIVIETFPGGDDLVRSVKIRTIQDGCRATTFIRPVTELILLLSEKQD